MTLAEIVAILDATGGANASSVRGVSTDTRTLKAGELYFALRGENFDGHEFVADGLRRGASGAVVARDEAGRVAVDLSEDERARLLVVSDPLTALGALGAAHRRRLKARVIAVAGSNGKTTTKAMIDHLLRERLRGRASLRSFNNNIGVPLTLLSAEAEDDYLVVEVGSNAPGEVAALGRLVEPDIAVITSIGEEHLEGFGDLAGVAAEEASILDWLRADGVGVVNADSPELREALRERKGRLIPFGFGVEPGGRLETGPTQGAGGRLETGPTQGAGGRLETGSTQELGGRLGAGSTLRVSNARYESPWLRFELVGYGEFALSAPGAHNALNAAAALGVARELGIEPGSLKERLRSFSSPPMRSQLLEIGGVTVLHDAYNANPASAIAAIEALESLPAQRRIAVIGEMLELGERSAEMHARVARRLRDSGISIVLLVGRAWEMMHAELRGGPLVEHAPTVSECGQRLAELARGGDAILLKASRGVGLERALESLQSTAVG